MPESVAIALPVHNGAEHLEEALSSFRAQAYPHFELVICDNASTDATPEIARSFARQDRRFVHLRQEEFLNARDNFIRAYRLTNREHAFFLWACDDNVWHPLFLRKTVDYLRSHPDCAACGVQLHRFGGAGPDEQVSRRMPRVYQRSRLLHFALERSSSLSLYSLMRRGAIDAIDLDLGSIRDYPDRYYLIQLRGQGYFHVIDQDLLGFRSGGISTTGEDSWARSVIDNHFGEEEYRVLDSLRGITRIEKAVLSLKFAYIALRHHIPGTVWRAWLAPAHVLARVMEAVRPSPWRVRDGRLHRED